MGRTDVHLYGGGLPPGGGLAVTVEGNMLVDGDGQRLWLRGVNWASAEYAALTAKGAGDSLGPFGPNGPKVDPDCWAAMAAWGINCVRLPLNEGVWLGGAGVSATYGGARYQTDLATCVGMANQAGMYVILDLQWSAAGTQPAACIQPQPNSDHSVTFWAQVADAYKNNPAVIFDLYNECYDMPDWRPDEEDGWTAWRDGADYDHQMFDEAYTSVEVSWTSAGMQTLIDTVRATGATNPVLVTGLGWGNDFAGWLSHVPNDPAGQMIASWHQYSTSYPNTTPASWDTAIAPILDAGYPVLLGELGGTYAAPSTSTTTALDWAEAHGVGWLGWTWNQEWGEQDNVVIQGDYDDPDPTPGLGTVLYNRLQSAPVFTGTSDIVSIGQPTYASSGTGSNATDGDPSTSWSATGTQSIAVDLSDVAAGHRRVVALAWYATPDSGYTVETNGWWCAAWAGRPYLSGYTVEVNAAAGGGSAPTSGWVTRETVTGNQMLTGMHTVDMEGMNWVRLGSATGPNGIGINLDIADYSGGNWDGWLFAGDSITNTYADHADNPWPATIFAATGRSPLLINRGADCSLARDAIDWVDDLIADFPGRYVSVAWGGNDAWAGGGDAATYQGYLESLCDTVIEAGKIPVVPTITWPNNGGSWETQVEAFNTRIRSNIWTRDGVLAGPDLYELTDGHPSWFNATGDVHPNATGAAQIRSAWGTRMVDIYGGA